MTPEQGSPRNLTDSDVVSVYTSLEELLLTDAEVWKQYLFDPVSERRDGDSEELAKAVANWCYHHEQGSNFITSKVVPYEIERTQSLALLLRGESFSSRVLLEYGKLVGWSFLRKAIKSIVKKLVQKGVSFEVDPSRLAPALNHSASDSSILPRSRSTGELHGDSFTVTSSPSAPCLSSTLHEEPQSPTQPKKFSQSKRGRGSRIGSRRVGQEAPSNSNASASNEEEQTESTEETVELRGSRIAMKKLDFSTLPHEEQNEEILLTRLRAETTGNEQATEERKQPRRSGSRSGSRVEFSNSESADEKKRSGGSRIRIGLQHSNPADECLTELEKNRNNLIATANLVLDAFVSLTSAETVPPELRDLCMSIHEASNQKFPTSGYTAVSGLLFLRYLCPAIVSPRQHGLVNPDSIKPKVQRSLVLLAKLLQAAASQTSFDPEKEAYMMPFNSWLASSRPQIEVIYANILRIAKEERRLTSSGSNLMRRLRKSPSASTIPGSSTARLPHIALIYRHILKVMASNSPRKSSNENLERIMAEVRDNLLLQSARIDLSDQELDLEQATELAHRIQQFGIETVREVDLRNNRIQGEGLQTLLTTLLTPTSGIEKLDLSGCELRSNDLKVLARLVQQNSSLQEVILDESLIEDPTVLPSIESILASNRKKLNHSGGAIKRRISSIAKHVFGLKRNETNPIERE